MKETNFIKQNIDKWNDYENELIQKKKNPQNVSKLFIQITDDLAYAQTFYKNRSVRVYLNGIAQLLFNDINKRSRFKFSSITKFWSINLPIVLFKARFELLFSFLVFSIMVGIGVISSIYEPDFAASILGDDYVQMTIENINNNDPMAVYKQQNGFDMFLGITLNNLVVAFRTFIFGLLFGIGTFLSLLHNGVMLGSFQYFFIERGLFKESFLTIWQHGTLEISAIIIAGAAGFTIGRGLILPGTYTRFQSLRITARRGLKIMIGLIPVFMMAGFIEGFFTRHTDVPDFIRLSTIILSLAFVLFYFVFYPARVAKKYPEKLEIADTANKTDSSLPSFNIILSNEDLFGGTLKLLKTSFKTTIKFLLIAAASAGVVIALGKEFLFHGVGELLIEEKMVLLQFIDLKTNFTLSIIHLIVFSLVLIFSSVSILGIKEKKKIKAWKFLSQHPIVGINAILGLIILLTPYFLKTGFGIFCTILLLPFISLSFFVASNEKVFLLKGLSKSFKILKLSFGRFVLLNMEFLAISLLILLLFSPDIYSHLLSFVHWNLWLEDNYVNLVINFITGTMFYSVLIFCLNLIFTSNNLLYYSLLETSSSQSLLKSIDKIGVKNSMKGYEFE